MIETHTMTIIRQHHSNRKWCEACGREVEVVPIEEASALAGIMQPALRDCAEMQGWHLSEAMDGALSVCLESLLKSL